MTKPKAAALRPIRERIKPLTEFAPRGSKNARLGRPISHDLIYRVPLAIKITMERREKLGKMADKLNCSMQALVEEGIDLVLAVKIEKLKKDFQKG